jgi:hypothetical protein
MAYYETELAKLNERISAVEAAIRDGVIDYYPAPHLAPNPSVAQNADKAFTDAVAASKSPIPEQPSAEEPTPEPKEAQ